MTDNRTNEPTEAQVEAAAKVLLRDYQSEYDGGEVSEFLDVARAALAAAHGAARPVNGFDTTAERVKNAGESSHVLDPEKVADVIEIEIESLRHETRLYPDIYKRQVADALCEAYTEGKLSW